ncbi:methyltransferase domain-containing protein [Diaphorobacter limosus]|uniref:Methyltransferase domain-containing protein n=1 Tax=Diaphorobacter limosus TaxID=3036128 RepID=A0ABZ0J0Z1_9BURK|nr:methyltransferase domain-containing protein [Diaphorobacter sp. Y-1]WOO31846.1 methyltransferase domain-containing protein [Diaphorobacter sp. Y-1]
MHPSAMDNGRLFFDAYAAKIDSGIVVDIGSQDVNGSLREVCPPHLQYIGVDFADAKGVDVVLQDPYRLPFADDSVDVVVSSSCFEHSEFFWVLFLEILRVLKKPGLFYLNAPSNGTFHRYPVDCWRFFPDSGAALVNWGLHNKVDVCLLETYIRKQNEAVWSDCVSIFLKGREYVGKFPTRITQGITDFYNAKTIEHLEFMNFEEFPEDLQRIHQLEVQKANNAT